MRIAASNIALPDFEHEHLLPRLRELGIEGLEIAPEHTWTAITPRSVGSYRAAMERAGLSCVGMHAVLNRKGLGLFEDAEARGRTADFLVYLSSVCRDLGGRTLILAPQWRRGIADKEAWQRCRGFLDHVLARIENHGTVLCLSPEGPAAGDFCATAKECYLLVNALDHPAFGLHLGAAGLAATGEMGHATFAAVRGRLDHFHVNEPELDPLGGGSRIDHEDLRRHLAAISYFDWISVLQKTAPGQDPVEALGRAVRFVTDRYLPIDTR